jgi:dihydroorotase
VTVLDPSRKRQVDPKRFESKGRSTPFAGWILKGWPVLTIVGGRVVFDDTARK